MKHRTRTVIITVITVLLLLSAALEIMLVFRVTSAQNKRSGADRLELASGELAETIGDAKVSTMGFAIELQQYLDDRSACEALIREKKQEMIAATDSACFNVYAAAEDWFYIPDFDSPADYVAEKRTWYVGAIRCQGMPYVSDPYVDAMTGEICYTVSIMLGDGKTVAAMDYTMENIQQHIQQLYRDGRQTAVIVTAEGIIAGCSDESLIGKSLIQELPDYAGVYSLVKNGEESVSIQQRGENLFASPSGFGWYLIISEDNWSLYHSTYIQIIAMLIISLVILQIIVSLYGLTARSAREMEQQISGSRDSLSSIRTQLMEAGSQMQDDTEARTLLASAITSLDSLAAEDNALTHSGKKRRSAQEVTISRHYRPIIIAALLLVTAICVYINMTAAVIYGRGQMQKAVSGYESQLSDWISTQKSILDMFCSYISTDPEMLEDYDQTVAFLDGITKQYPEISVSYIANPEFEHNVIMSNGWEAEDWDLEGRPWYKELMASGRDWMISSPYYDMRTGLYCVTFAEKVYDAKTGEYIGNFGIDFYMDKLVDILGSSYTDSGYAFLADARGDIINHPYGKFQMTEEGATNVVSLPYSDIPLDGSTVRFIRDYTGSVRVAIATRNEASGFSIYVVSGVWTNYKGVIIYGTICILVLILCVIIVYKVMTGLVFLQDEANRKLRESAEAAIAADEAKSTFLAQMSHEIRTPINAVLGMNEMILHESSDPDIREYAGNIQSSGRTLLSLINSILDFSKIEDGKMEIIPVAYDTAEMLHDLVNSVAQRAKDKGLTLLAEADESLPRMLRGDDVRIRQVITNLLTNAVKYTETGTVKLIVRREEAAEGRICMYVEVTDTGIGIREEDIGNLFVSFKRLDVKRNRNIEGTGLGMSIVTRLLEMMGSKLEVSSVYGEGSTFSFRLEQEIADAAPMGSFEAKSAQDVSAGRYDEMLYAPDARVLVVDDNAMNLRVAEGLLSLYGIKADTSDSGAKALEILQNAQYDIIFLDHMMPGMDGIEVLQEIRKRSLVPEETVIVALTANAIVGAREMYLNAGFAGYLTKPIESKALEAQLRAGLPESKKQYRAPEPPKKEEAPADADSMTMEELLRIRAACGALNVMEGLGNCMDSREFYLDTLAGFVESEQSDALREAFEKADWDSYRIKVHSVKSAARTIGADVLSEHARMLEFAARDGDIAYLEAHHADFLADYQRIIEEIGKVLNHE